MTGLLSRPHIHRHVYPHIADQNRLFHRSIQNPGILRQTFQFAATSIVLQYDCLRMEKLNQRLLQRIHQVSIVAVKYLDCQNGFIFIDNETGDSIESAKSRR